MRSIRCRRGSSSTSVPLPLGPLSPFRSLSSLQFLLIETPSASSIPSPIFFSLEACRSSGMASALILTPLSLSKLSDF